MSGRSIGNAPWWNAALPTEMSIASTSSGRNGRSSRSRRMAATGPSSAPMQANGLTVIRSVSQIVPSPRATWLASLVRASPNMVR